MTQGDGWSGVHRSLRRLVVAHTAVIVVWAVLALVWRDGHWLLEIVNQFGPGVFVWSTAAAVGIALVLRRFGLVVAAGLPLLVLAVLYLPYLLPGSAEPPGEPDLRVMTFNILNNNNDLAAVAGVIIDAESDIVAIQELREERVDEFRSLLADRYPHAVVSSPARGGTTALLSTRPFVAETILDPGIDRPIAVGTVEVAGQSVTVLSAHLLPKYYALQQPLTERSGALRDRLAGQHREAEAIITDLAGRDGLVVLGCDCNTTDLNRTNQILSDVFVDPTRELGWPRTDPPAGLEHERRRGHLDYVWYRPTDGVAALGAYRVPDRAGSDHHAIIVDFDLHADANP